MNDLAHCRCEPADEFRVGLGACRHRKHLVDLCFWLAVFTIIIGRERFKNDSKLLQPGSNGRNPHLWRPAYHARRAAPRPFNHAPGMAQTFWGATLVMKGDSTEAVEVLKEARAAGIWNSVTLGFNDYYLTSALIASGQTAEAQALMAATPTPPHPSFALSRTVMMGITRACLNEADAARASFTAALESAGKLIHGPDRFDVLYRRGIANAGLALLDQDEGRLTTARADFAAARNECAAPGIVRLHTQLLDALMVCPGGERLASVRAALAGHLVSTT